MRIENDKFVELTYELRVKEANGDLVEQTTAENPLSFIYGSGRLLPKFEAELDGLSKGESFTFSLNPGDAYGEVNPNAIVEVPIQAFEVDGKVDENLVKVGNSIPMMDSSGQRMTGIVREITQDAVKMDFNHPMAGETLFFSGMVHDVREATQEEIDALNGCGCGSGCGCGEGDEHGQECSDSGCGTGCCN